MKFQKLSVFEKHFREALSHHLSAIYVVVCPNENERKKILSSLMISLNKRSDFIKTTEINRALEHVRSASLFFKTTVALCDGVEKFLKEDRERLHNYCRLSNKKNCLLLGSARMQEVADLYKICKNDMVIIDLSKEKPWDEKERFLKWIIQSILYEKKQISPQAAEELLERFPKNRFLLQQEIGKLLCFIGNRREITLSDIKAICGSSIEQSSYQQAKSIVWDENFIFTSSMDLTFLIRLISAIRLQLEIGLKLCVLHKKGASKEEIVKATPFLFPKALQHCTQVALRKGCCFFEKGLMYLFDFELGLKSSKGRPDVLYALFVQKLHLKQ